MKPTRPTNRKPLAIVGLLVIVLIVAVAVLSPKHSTQNTAATQPMPTSSSSSGTGTSSGSTSTAAATYKDGTYSATGHYDSPGGEQAITVQVSLKNDVVTATSATSGAIDSEGAQFQSDFISAYKSMVVGKDINTISLSQVSGSSLTSQGFNAALSDIKSQAKA